MNTHTTAHSSDDFPQTRSKITKIADWPTLAVLFLCFALMGIALAAPHGYPLQQALLMVFALVLHSSLSHEIMHGHPFRARSVNTALGLFQPGFFIPFLRFRALHLAHHRNPELTDPYDDPESNYLDPERWERLPRAVRIVLVFNNTLLGRMLIGPAIGLGVFLRDDLRRIAGGERHIAWQWIAHLPSVAVTLWLVSISSMPLWLYLVAAYGALSVLRIRTFAEHRADARVAARSVIIEDRGPLAFLFLNNNLHVVHHVHPHLPWYKLPGVYRARRARFRRMNGGYVYRSYADLFAAHLFRMKDPVAHPLWRGRRK